MRIKSWHFEVRNHHELIPRTMLAMHQDLGYVETLGKNITRQGITNNTLEYLSVSRVVWLLISRAVCLLISRAVWLLINGVLWLAISRVVWGYMVAN